MTFDAPEHRRPTRRALLLTLVTVLSMLGVAAVALPGTSQAHTLEATATVRSASQTVLGTVHFVVTGDKTLVQAKLKLPASIRGWNEFHGFHIHANDNPANGNGCVADPAQPPATWFTSADGHLSDLGQAHGGHRGDMPSLLVNGDETAQITFTTDRLSVADLQDRVVIVHAGPDNFGNVPVGPGPEQYAPNSPAATAKTAATGNAGDRVGCGIIRIGAVGY